MNAFTCRVLSNCLLMMVGSAVGVAYMSTRADTNAPPAAVKPADCTYALGVSTNGDVQFEGKLIGRISNCTNYTAVPDVAALNSAHESGFALGVRYGALATRRNPDVSDWTALIEVAKALLAAEQQQQQQPRKRSP